jgi:hypothetical protein
MIVGSFKTQTMPTTWNNLRITAVLAIMLLLHAGIAGAQVAGQPDAGGLSITIIDEGKPIMNTRQRVNREAIVQVEDENHKPVAGALVLFLAPDNGPSAVFSNSARSITLTTDEQGRVALNLTQNKTAGNYQIKVTASKNGRTATSTLNQTNVIAAGSGAAAGGVSAKLIWVLVAVGAAAGIGIAVAASGGKSSTPAATIPSGTSQPPPIILTPGTPGVGPPH